MSEKSEISRIYYVSATRTKKLFDIPTSLKLSLCTNKIDIIMTMNYVDESDNLGLIIIAHML